MNTLYIITWHSANLTEHHIRYGGMWKGTPIRYERLFERATTAKTNTAFPQDRRDLSNASRYLMQTRSDSSDNIIIQFSQSRHRRRRPGTGLR